jgi:diacylglycerol kinase family enzyme
MAERRPRRRVAVIFNPATCGERAAERKRELVEALTAAGADDVLVEETTLEDPGRGATERALAQGVDVVLAAGGDGTVMSCASALAGSRVPLAVLPNGTGNLLANNLDLPDDPQGAAEVALHGRRRRLDVGALDGDGVDGDRFVVMSGMGFDAAMLRDTDPSMKDRVGAFAYVISGLRQVGRRPAEYRISLDGLPPFSRVGQGMLVGNLGRLQGGLEVLPGASPDDGMLDVGVLQTRSLAGWLRLLGRVLLRRGRRGPDGPPLELFRATRVEVDCSRPQPIERDGDTAPPRRHLAVEVLPGALTLCVPEPAEAGPREAGPREGVAS